MLFAAKVSVFCGPTKSIRKYFSTYRHHIVVHISGIKTIHR